MYFRFIFISLIGIYLICETTQAQNNTVEEIFEQRIENSVNNNPVYANETVYFLKLNYQNFIQIEIINWLGQTIKTEMIYY